jgi:hypothetical protein
MATGRSEKSSNHLKIISREGIKQTPPPGVAHVRTMGDKANRLPQRLTLHLKNIAPGILSKALWGVYHQFRLRDSSRKILTMLCKARTTRSNSRRSRPLTSHASTSSDTIS